MGDGDPAGEEESVARTFAEVARLLLAEEGLDRTLTRVAELAVATIDGSDHAGVSLMADQGMTSTGASDELPAKIDALVIEVGQGPCLDAISHGEVIEVTCLAEEQRWPLFSKRAAEETGVMSILAFQLFDGEQGLGALTLYSKSPSAFDREAQELGWIFAAHAAVALVHARKEEQLHAAIMSRDVIGQAKGILMARQGLTPDQAFQTLVRASQRLNVKLREVAGRVVDSNTNTAPPGPAD